MPEGSPPADDEQLAVDRRHAMKMTAGVAASAAFGPGAARGETLPRQTAPGADVMTPPYGQPSMYEAHVVRRERTGGAPYPTRKAAVSLTPLQDLHGVITPNGLHYERHHSGVPTIDPNDHRLIIHGEVEKPMNFSLADIMRFPAVSRIRFLECSGNTQNWGEPVAEYTVQDTHGLLSCCEWTGTLLKRVLGEVGVRPEARWMLAEGADAATMTRSIPVEKALDDAVLAYAQNGEKLRPEQGYPLRLLLPGFEGNTSVKWLRRLKFGREPWQTREETSKYTWLMPDGSAREVPAASEDAEPERFRERVQSRVALNSRLSSAHLILSLPERFSTMRKIWPKALEPKTVCISSKGKGILDGRKMKSRRRRRRSRASRRPEARSTFRMARRVNAVLGIKRQTDTTIARLKRNQGE